MTTTIYKPNSFKNPFFILLSLLAFGAILLAYSNHFSNDFQFDDNHCIKNNTAIREIDVARFFKDGTTFSALPSNQSYRPFLTTENAIDYKLSGGSGTTMFHIHIFKIFILVCILLCVFVKKLLDKIQFSSHNQFWGLLSATIFGLLCANAETVNYISQRGEIDSAFFILAGLTAFLHGGVWRKKYLYLLFPFIGFFAKEMTFVFAPLLLLYILIFEENADLLHFYRAEELKKWRNAIIKAMPSFVLTVLFLGFYKMMLPATWTSGSGQINNFLYLVTQPMVICHYIITYFIPYNLSADSGWKVYDSVFDYRAIAGIIVIAFLIYLALNVSNNRNLRLFSFGLLWFFISLLPTSSLLAFAEVLNDHRCFIPYLGLTIAFIFGLKYLSEKYFPEALKQKTVRRALIVFLALFLGANGYGVYQRNKVWHDGMSLWRDVTVKSPDNGRGLMNYGLELMAKGDYSNAEKYFMKALPLTPNYNYLYINLGILNGAMRKTAEAEQYFQKAISLPDNRHISWYYFGRFLSEQGRNEQAMECLQNALKIVPDYYFAQDLSMQIYHRTNDWDNLERAARSILKKTPHDANALKYLDIAVNKKTAIFMMEEDAAKAPAPEKYLNLSLAYFQMSNFDKCIAAAKEALKLRNNYAEAYNNIGIANFYLKKYDEALEAYQKALAIKPGYGLAEKNMEAALAAKNKMNVPAPVTVTDFINLSLKFYQQGKYAECIDAAKKSIAIKPSANAYNNMCAAYNQLKQYDKAIHACNEALKLEPNHTLAKGNLNYALKTFKKW